MKYKLKKWILFLITAISITLFAKDGLKTPNEVISENPKREVTTIESIKLRENAKMSLSITKVIPEEIMGKLENGNLNVFISKKNKNRKLDKSMNISALNLKAYSNPKQQQPMLLKNTLTAEDIKNMQKDFSKEKNIKIIEDTDEYIRLQVENVTENEKIYINIMNGNKVVKSYRIGEVSPYNMTDEQCWGIRGQLINSTLERDSAKVMIGNYWIDWITSSSISGENSGINEIRMFKFPMKGEKISFQDEFFSQIRQATISSDSPETGFRILSKTKNITEIHVDSARNGKGQNINTSTGKLWYQNYRGADNITFGDSREVTFRELTNIREGERTTCTVGRPSGAYKQALQGQLMLGFNFGVEILEKNLIPGIYNYNNAISVLVTYYNRNGQKENQEIKSNYKLDIGENKKNIEEIFYGGKNDNFYIDHSQSVEYGLSFMSKNGFFGQHEAGIWHNNKKLTPENNQFIVKSGNSEIKVILEQKDNEFIKLRIVPVTIQETTNFIFTLAQGRKTGSEIRKLREIEYNITIIKTNDFGMMTYNMDSRIGKAENETIWGDWVFANGKIKNNNGIVVSDFPEMIEVTEDIKIPSKRITEVTNINGRTGSELTDNTSKKYKTERSIALPYDVQSDAYRASYSEPKITISKTDVNQARQGNDINVEHSFVLKDETNTFWSGKLKENYLKSKESNSDSGEIDMSNATLEQEYIFAPGESNPQNSNISLITTKSLDARGVLEKNKNKNIADKIIFESIGRDGKREVVEVEKSVKTGQRIGPQSVPQLDRIFSIGISSAGGLIIKKTGDGNFPPEGKKVKVKYYLTNKATINGKGPDILLGTYDLTVKCIRTVKDIGVVNVNIDSRVAQIAPLTSWIRLNGQIGDLNDSGGVYENFIKVEGDFDRSKYTDTDKITTIERINNQSPTEEYGIYKKVPGENEAAMPFKKDNNYITMLDFVKTDRDSKLIVSKHDITSDSHNGKNEFLISGTDINNRQIAYTGNIQEIYKNKNGQVSLPIRNSGNTAYDGSGSLNLVAGEIGQEYSFHVGRSGNINSQPNAIILKVDSGKESLDATGVVTNMSSNIANKMKVTINNSSDIINSSNGKLEKEILDSKVKIGINKAGELTVTKLKHENITNTQVVIEYYYDPVSNGNTITQYKAIKLGTFILTLSNPIKELGDITFKIDKRIAGITNGDWITPNGTVRNSGGEVGKYSNLVYSTDTINIVNTTEKNQSVMEIVKIMETSGKDLLSQAGQRAEYKYLQKSDKDIVALPYKKGNKDVKLAQYDVKDSNSLVVISKADISSTYKAIQTAESTFEIRTDDTIYQGKLKEEYLGEGIYSGVGNIDLSKLTENTKYIFKTEATENEVGVLSTSKKRAAEGIKIILNGNDSKPVNGKGVVDGTVDKNIVDKIKVEYTNSNGNTTIKSTDGNLEVNYSGLMVGIDTTGGLTLQKTQKNTGLTEIKVTYYAKNALENGSGELELGNFTLSIKDNQFEIDGDNVLEFGKMFYRENAPFETRVKEFKVKNPENKNIKFSVAKEARMNLVKNNPMKSTSEEIKLTNIEVQKKSNTSFELQATANLTPETQSGNYQGEIEVTVTITDNQ